MSFHKKINLIILIFLTLLTACTSLSETSPSTLDSDIEQTQKLDQSPVSNLQENDIETFIFQGDEFFGFDQTEINKTTQAQLDNIIQQTTLTNKHILIVGHTDNRGAFEVNVHISNQRAENVKQYLLRKGINKNDITSIGLGMLYPLLPNNSQENREKNRRVELLILPQEKKEQYLSSYNEKKKKLLQERNALANQTESTDSKKANNDISIENSLNRSYFSTFASGTEQKTKILFPNNKFMEVEINFDKKHIESAIIPISDFPSASESKFFQRLTFICWHFLKTTRVGPSHKNFLSFHLISDKNSFPYLFKIKMSDLRLLNNRRFTEDDANALSTEGKVYPINEILKRGYFVSLNNQLQLNTTRRYRVFLDNQTSLPEYEKTITQIFKANQK